MIKVNKLLAVMSTVIISGMSFSINAETAEEKSLAEDPFEVASQLHKNVVDRPWESRSPEEMRKWVKENLHFKLRAKKVIDEKDHPEWAWLRKSGLGLFLHWGPTSVSPNNGDAWAMKWSANKAKNKRKMILPEDMFRVAETWNPEQYDPEKWMAAAAKAGFGYSVLTTRHHDGYALWPSKHGTWDTGDHMGGKDLVKGYVVAARNNGIRVGLYYSGPNWHYDYKNKDFSQPAVGVNYKHEKVGHKIKASKESARLEKQESAAQVKELVTNYGKIDMMWWDGNSIMSEKKLAEYQPDIFVARGNIATPEGAGHGKSEFVKATNEAGWWWELCIKSEERNSPFWHYNESLEKNHWDANKLLSELIRVRSLGGNLLVNITPRPNGEMMDWYYEMTDELALWMKHSREATYDVDLNAPLPTLDNTENFTTKRGNTWYSMPDTKNTIFITDVTQPKSVTLLRTGEKVAYKFVDGSLQAVLPKTMQTSLPDLVKIVF
jgi:alpha-L-fucosidase